MKKCGIVGGFVLVLFVAVSLAAPLSAAQVAGGTWELGVIMGEPTGLSAKYWMSQETALDFGAAWSFKGDGQFHLHVDYLFHKFDIFKVESGSLPLYFGIGGRLRFDEDDGPGDEDGSRLGLRLVLGLEYLVEDYPMSLFFEVAPIIDVAPETEGDINGGLGIRYVF